ncbi:MAG: energy transducer TonB [Thermodesulfobacteriota bacterium]
MEKQRFKVFLIISITVHLCVIFLVGSISFKPIKGRTLTVEIPPLSSKPEEKSSNTKFAKQSIKKTLQLTSIHMESVNNIIEGYKTRKPLSSKREDTILLNTRNPKYITYSSKIKRKIELVWEYPHKAKKEEMKGKLTLMFSILRNGELEGLQLLKSSGFPILDNGAFNAVRLAAPYYPIPQTMEINKLNFIATFEYRIDY